MPDLVFDLDGTLVDSSTGILKSLEFSFCQCGVDLSEKLDKKLIGPPLYKTVEKLANSSDQELISRLIETFKKHYDDKGYLDTYVFEGIAQLLEKIYKDEINVFIVTNKRKIPTMRIINHLGWGRYFKDILSIDSLGHAKDNKADLIGYLINKYNLNNEIYYIGDTKEDQRASSEANIKFIFASWGYGSIIDIDKSSIAERPGDIRSLI